MQQNFAKDVYYTLTGNMTISGGVPGVKNAFAPNSECDLLYQDMYDAYARLCTRLGVLDEDEDLEIIVQSLLRITDIISLEMYQYGAKFGSNKCTQEGSHWDW